MATPDKILENALHRARASINQPLVLNSEIRDRISYVVRCLSNRAGVRMLMTCALAKIHRPEVDIRKPYTEVGDTDAFSGRAEYDEKYVGPFAAAHALPVNSTTAFLTPGFRTINVALAPPLVISGRPKRMYEDTIQLLDDVCQGRVTEADLLAETIRQLLLLKEEQDGGIEFVILDCLGFLRHFLHLFHRRRLIFLESYQKLVLSEPDSAVSQPLKELFLALRRAAEFDSEA